MQKKFLFLTSCLLLVFAQPSQALSLNDLTLLLPLPTPEEFQTLLSPGEKGAQGPLLSQKTFEELPQLVPEVENEITWQDSLRVIGVRIDPCFTEGVGPQACRRQIRLVWQPVFFISGDANTRDAAVHSFYDFDEVTFAELWKSWPKSENEKQLDPLMIQPLMKQEGLHGVTWQKVRALILKYCGEKNLTRMTAMNVMAGEQMWIFMGYDIQNGIHTPIKIPRIHRGAQGVIQSSSSSRSFTGGMRPAPLEDSDFGKFVADSITAKKSYSEVQIKNMMGKVHEYENPTKHNPGTLDCASCHLAHTVHRWGLLNMTHWDWRRDFSQVTYQSPFNLENTSPGPLRTNQLRAFGYFMKWPVFSQRVVNETAAVAESLSAKNLY